MATTTSTATAPSMALLSSACPSLCSVCSPPEFAYVCPLESGGGGKPAAASCVMCSVCLEDVHGGEMVRQLPACRHIFHVECIDMWLHSHRTCPMCRCVISPPPMVTAKAAAPESSDEALPPV